MSKCDVLICGAGAAGLTLAIDLARRGVSARLIEKMERPFAGSRGRGIQPRTQEIFEDLGVVDHLFALGDEYPPQRIYDKNGGFRDEVRMVPVEATTEEPYQRPLMIPQFMTETVLRAKLLEYGRAPEFSIELTGFTQDAEGVTATLRTPNGIETLRARYLIGCDGGKSFVRHHLAIDFPGKSFGIRVLAADVRIPGLARNVGHEWNDGDMAAQLGIDPLPSTDLFSLRAPVSLEGEIDTSAEAISALASTRSGQKLEIAHVAWASVFVMGARLAAKYRVERVFLCGDAAHVHPPTGGQGLNTSVQDAYNLGWKLALALSSGDEQILKTYEEERRPIAEGMLGLSTKILKAEKEGGGTKRGREVLQLDLSYAGSSITLSEPVNRIRIAGDRAPDAPFTTAAGLRRRLFDVFHGPHFTLLAYETSIELKPKAGLQIYRIGGEHGEIRDTEATIAGAYGLNKGDLMLIRPDGYIGAIVSSDHMGDLKNYFKKVGL
jgi:2-polyprenyl-6-methoxyphenol hydroxylase-like FAD-dependent oxidoreductase